MEQNQQPPAAAPATPVPAEPVSNTIVYDDFAKVQLRVGTVVEASAIEKSKKLLKLQVDLGTERRQILAGIKEHYTPEQMIGRQIVVVVNLAPREVMKGEFSNGMLLAASDPATGKVVVVAPSDVVSPGSGVK
jgi:methionine--tRNA ligase beta chain